MSSPESKVGPVGRYVRPACRSGFISAVAATRLMSSTEGGAVRLSPNIQGITPRWAAMPMVERYGESAKKPGFTIVTATFGSIAKR